jgi:hypothetical protein
MNVGVMKDWKLKLRNLHDRIHWVPRGTGTPKDKDEVNRREVCEYDGWVCDLDVMDDPSKLSVIRKAAAKKFIADQ